MKVANGCYYFPEIVGCACLYYQLTVYLKTKFFHYSLTLEHSFQDYQA